MGSPKVSVVIPTRNRRVLLEKTLDSVQAQTFPHWEAVVIDDGSTDDTGEYMERLCREEPRFRFLHRTGEHGNANVCRNQGLAASLGAYIVFLDSDDLLAPWCLEHRVKDMDEHSHLSFITYLSELFAEIPGDMGILWNIFTTESDLSRFLRIDPPWSTTGPIWRKDALINMTWNEDMPSWQDQDFHTRMLSEGCMYARVNKSDHYVRRGDSPRGRIGKVEHLPEHLMCHINAFCSLTNGLSKRRLLTRERALSIEAVIYLKCWWLFCAGHPHLALNGWRKYLATGCCGSARSWDGLVTFAMCQIPLVRSMASRYIQIRMDEYNRVLDSSTSLQVLIESDVVLAHTEEELQ